MPLYTSRGNILKLEQPADAMAVPVINLPCVGVGFGANMLHAAGISSSKIMEQRQAMGELRFCEARAGDGLGLAGHLIWTAVPRLSGEYPNRINMRKCYANILKCAEELGAKSVAIPVMHFYGQLDLFWHTLRRIAENAVNGYLAENDCMDVYLVEPDGSIKEMPKNIAPNPSWQTPLCELREIRAEVQEEMCKARAGETRYADKEKLIACKERQLARIDKLISEKVSEWEQDEEMEEKWLVYREANPDSKDPEYDREKVCTYINNYVNSTDSTYAALSETIGSNKSTVSRILSGQTKNPSKKTCIALALAMKLSREERTDFIRCAGHNYPTDSRDYFVEKCIMEGITDLYEINELVIEKNPEWILVGTMKDGIAR